MVNGDHRVEAMHHHVGADGRKGRNLRLGLQLPPEIIGHISGPAALERRQAPNFSPPFALQKSGQQIKRLFLASPAIKKCFTVPHFQCLIWIDGEEGITPQMFVPLGAFKQRQRLLARKPPRQLEGFGIDDFTGKGSFGRHEEVDIGLERNALKA